jgi:uncharacterized membrane protein
MEFIARFINALVDLHPPHTLTVHFPIGLTGAALLFVLLALWRRSPTLEQAAFLNVALASVSAVVAGLVGYRDHLVRYEGNAPLSNAKIFLALSLFVLTTITAIVRRRRPEVLWNPSTVVLYVSAFVGSFALAAALGFLGGVILYGF